MYRFVEHGDGAYAWVNPRNDEVKITVDVATSVESTSYGMGMWARNGEVILGNSKLYQGNMQPEFAEALAVL